MDTGGSGRSRQIVTGMLIAAALIFLVLAGREAAAVVPRFAEQVASLGAAGPLLFILGYIVATVAFVPGSLLTLAAGAVFGVVRGVAIVFIGATLGAAAAFLVARHLVRRRVERRLAGSERFTAIDRAIGHEGFRIVLLLRLSPVFPFNLMNYALGVTRVRLRDFVLASVGMLPGTLLYVYYGRLAGDVTAAAAGMQPDRGVAEWILLGVGLVATIAVTALITRAARRALAEVAE